MPIITEKINKILEKKNLTQYKLAKLVNYDRSALNNIIKGNRTFPEDLIHKIAVILEITPEEIKGWVLVDKYPEAILQRVLELKQGHKDKLIFTAKVNEIMRANNLTVTPFSREIGYNQGRLSQVLLGNKSVSDRLVQKLSAYSGISEHEIKNWTIADKYSIGALESALSNF